MSTGIVKRGQEVPAEKIVTTLINLPRLKLDLIAFRDEKEHYFVLRRMRFLAPDNVQGIEIRLDLETARVLRTALKREMEESAADITDARAA